MVRFVPLTKTTADKLANNTALQWLGRFGDLCYGVVHVVVAVLTLRLIFAAPTRSESSRQRDWTAQLLGLPGGQILVVVVGLAVIAGAVVLGYRGVKRSFLDDLDPLRLHGSTRTTVGWLGASGYLAKAVALAIVGILVVVAGSQANPARSGGLDTALRALAGQPYGDALLVIVSLGLIGYACYLAAEARYRRNR